MRQRRPAREIHAEVQAGLGEHFLDLVGATCVRSSVSSTFRPQSLDEFSYVSDAVVLQTVRRAEFEIFNAREEFASLLRKAVDVLAGPVREVLAEMEPDLGENFLQFVERLPSEVRNPEKLGLALTREVADEPDVVVLQAQRCPHRKLELVDAAVEVDLRRDPDGRHVGGGGGGGSHPNS